MRVGFQELQTWKHISSFMYTPEQEHFAISTSLRYMGKLWHNILKDEMVHHNQGYNLGKVAWYLMLGFSLWFWRNFATFQTLNERGSSTLELAQYLLP